MKLAVDRAAQPARTRDAARMMPSRGQCFREPRSCPHSASTRLPQEYSASYRAILDPSFFPCPVSRHEDNMSARQSRCWDKLHAVPSVQGSARLLFTVCARGGILENDTEMSLVPFDNFHDGVDACLIRGIGLEVERSWPARAYRNHPSLVGVEPLGSALGSQRVNCPISLLPAILAHICSSITLTIGIRLDQFYHHLKPRPHLYCAKATRKAGDSCTVTATLPQISRIKRAKLSTR